MARIIGLFPAALIAAKAGMSGNAFIRELRALGLAARDSELRNLLKLAIGIFRKSKDEPFKDPTSIPSGDELAPWPTKKATGVKQVVTLVYRDRTTGTQLSSFYSVTSEGGIPREDAVAKAINAYADHAEAYNQDLIGAVHSAAYQLMPVGV